MHTSVSARDLQINTSPPSHHPAHLPPQRCLGAASCLFPLPQLLIYFGSELVAQAGISKQRLLCSCRKEVREPALKSLTFVCAFPVRVHCQKLGVISLLSFPLGTHLPASCASPWGAAAASASAPRSWMLKVPRPLFFPSPTLSLFPGVCLNCLSPSPAGAGTCFVPLSATSRSRRNSARTSQPCPC